MQLSLQDPRGTPPAMPGNSSLQDETPAGDDIEPTVDPRFPIFYTFSFSILFNIDKEEGDELVQGLDHLQIGVFVPTLLLVLLPKVIVTPTPTAKVLSSVAKTTAEISIQEQRKLLIVA